MMAQRVKNSTTFKTHFFSALCRSTFTNMSLIFVNSVFVKAVGGKNYSQLFFFASMASLVYYVYFAFRGDRQAYKVYKVVIGLVLLASILCFSEQYVPALEPYNKPFLYFFAVSVVVVDLIGTTLGPVILQLSVNPAIFREVYQKIVTAELLARISAAAVIWILSSNHWLVYWYPVGWITLIIHFALFNVTITRLRRIERESGIKKDESEAIKKIGKALKFIFSNSMVRLAMSFMIWGHVSKFVVEYLFYQAADAEFSSARKIASFVSAVTMAMIVLALVVQQFVGRKLPKRLQLSTLFSFQPTNILVFGSIALLMPPFWPVVVLLVTYNVINRCVQLPVARQCLVPVPRAQRGTIVSMICIFMSSATMIASGLLASLKEVLHFQDFLVVLLVLGATPFLLITGLDSYYIRNLWSFYRESRSGRWQDEPAAENISEVELDSAGSMDEPAELTLTADLKSHPILETYATSFSNPELKLATRDHRELVRSNDVNILLLGLRICFITGFPWFGRLIKRALEHDSEEVREFATLAMHANDEFRGIEGYTSIFLRRIKTLTLELLTERSFANVDRLKSLLRLSDREAAESLVAALSDTRFKDLRETLLQCIADEGSRLTLEPIVKHMYELDYENGHRCRALLDRLSFGRNSPELRETIASNLAQLNKEKLALSKPVEAERDSFELQRFMHTLFAEEYRLCPKELDRALTDTIGEFQSLAPEDSPMLIDMHLEFLKRSELYRTWQKLLA